MRPLNRLLLAASSFALLAACGTARAPGMAPSSGAPSAEAQASDSVSAYRAATGFIAAFDSLQWERFRGYLADDITMFFPFPQLPRRVDGRQAVEEIFGEFMRSQRTRRIEAGQPLVQGLDPQDLRVQMAGPDVAIASFHLGGERPARRSIVFRRFGGGEWRVVHWHASSPPPAPAR